MSEFIFTFSPRNKRLNILRPSTGDFVTLDVKSAELVALSAGLEVSDFAAELYEQAHTLDDRCSALICRWAEPLLKENEPPAPKFATCPICGEHVEVGDKIILEWYVPRHWWVFRHLKLLPQDSTEHVDLEYLPSPDRDPKFRFGRACGRANYDVATDSFLPIPKD